MIQITLRALRLLSILILIAVSLCSCATHRDNISYMQDIMQTPDSLWNKQYSYAPKLKANDEVSIVVSAVDQAAAAAFNKTPFAQQTSERREISTVPSIHTYRVNERGEIDFPVIGTIMVKGKTTLEVQDYLVERIKEYVMEPIVSVAMINVTTVVLGEVTKPGICEFKGNRATLLEALGQVGDLTIYGRRDNVMLIRENEGRREAHLIDLTSADFVNSPYYYLQQNDVIYVSPNSSKRDSSRYNNLKSYNISLVGTIVSCVSVLASLAIAIWK